MNASPEQRVTARKEALAQRYRDQSGHVLVAGKFRTDSARLLAILSETPALGSMWVPLQGRTTNLTEAKALCAWFNSTLGALGFLMRRGTMLTNPSFSQGDLSTLPVPDFRATSPATLADAYERTKDMPVSPWKHAANDQMRDYLDLAAAETTSISIATIRDWRARVSKEPTVTGLIGPRTNPQ